MFKIDSEKVIHITRGDIASIAVKASNEDGTDYTFLPGDVIKFSVFQAKNYNNEVLRKEIDIAESLTSVDIVLTREDTKIGEIISKPVDYWYEIELNPNTSSQTIIGYDEDGAKIFRLYPEGADVR